LANAGCLLVAAGAAGGAAVGYAYCKGKVSATYNAGLGDTMAASCKAMEELGLPILKKSVDAQSGCIASRTGDGDKVRIYVDTEAARLPALGPTTRVCVRVATFGDHPLSCQILDQISLHLAPLPPDRPPAVPPAAPPQNAVQLGVPTGPPPLVK
jgi:hypothetical protein